MTDHEVLDIFFQASSDWSAKASILIGTISAFLVASFFMADKLNRAMAAILVALHDPDVNVIEFHKPAST